MGVKDLWSILQPASNSEALAQLAMRAFESNTYRHRGFTVGIDISIWFGHMKVFDSNRQCGRNPGLQMLFFRCARLAAIPILPLFVFDGQNRPQYKRGKKQRYTDEKIKADAQRIIDAFGFAWRCAPGEAEAELANLNSLGVIDAVWTDDGDAFLFGAVTVIRNPSKNLSANKKMVSLDSSETFESRVQIYKAADLHKNTIQLSRSGLILIALLRGGDYHEGVEGVGMTIAHALARGGFGDTLATAEESLQGEPLAAAVSQWRAGIIEELRTDSRGQLGKRHTKLAASFPSNFPDLSIYHLYAKPTVSSAAGLAISWYRAPDIARLADVCQDLFTWGSQTEILARFRSLVWQGAVCRALRQRTLEEDGMGDFLDPATADLDALVNQIHGERSHPSMDGLRELRLEIAPAQLADAVRAGTSILRMPSLKFTRGKARAAPDATMRIWLPAALICAAMPEVVRAFETAENAKRHDKGTKRSMQYTSGSSSDDNTPRRKASRNTVEAPRSQRAQVPQQPAPTGDTASSMASTSRVIIEISSSEDEANLHAAGSAASAARSQAQSADVIIISSSDDE